jgi:hypothetical protein
VSVEEPVTEMTRKELVVVVLLDDSPSSSLLLLVTASTASSGFLGSGGEEAIGARLIKQRKLQYYHSCYLINHSQGHKASVISQFDLLQEL